MPFIRKVRVLFKTRLHRINGPNDSTSIDGIVVGFQKFEATA